MRRDIASSNASASIFMAAFFSCNMTALSAASPARETMKMMPLPRVVLLRAREMIFKRKTAKLQALISIQGRHA